MKLEDIKKLVALLDGTQINRLHYKSEETEITIEQGLAAPAVELPLAAQPVVAPPVHSAAAAPPSQEVAPNQETPGVNADRNYIEAPLVGTFYRSPSPDSAAFVEVGDRVKKGDTVGIIEAMKLMNEITTEFDGVVAAIYVENAGAVEFGARLFEIKPA